MHTYLFVSSNQDQLNRIVGNFKLRLSVSPFNYYEIIPDGSISIDQIRDIKKVMKTKTYENQNRLVFIRSVEKATPEAQNALLKLLEEPPLQTYFALTAPDEFSILPTIVSRSHIQRVNESDTGADIQRIEENQITLYKICFLTAGERIVRAQNSGTSKEEVLHVLDDFLQAIECAILNKSDHIPLDKLTLVKIAVKIQAAKRFIVRNVNVKATLDVLFMGFPQRITSF